MYGKSISGGGSAGRGSGKSIPFSRIVYVKYYDRVNGDELSWYQVFDIIKADENNITITSQVVDFISGRVYFVGDLTCQYYTGKSITENLFDDV